MSEDLFRPDLELQVPSSIRVPRTRLMMSLNEGPRDPLRALWPGIARRLLDTGMNRYRKPITNVLLQELGRYARVGLDSLLMGNGADEVLYYLFTSVRRSLDDFIVTLAPTYSDYKRYARAVGLDTREVDLDGDFLFDPSEVLSVARHPNCRAVLVWNPNNPTGNLFPSEIIQELIHETSCLIIIDEAYYEFSGVTYLAEVASNPHVVLVRSFSKGFSAAGLRFGYLIGNPETVAAAHKVRTFFNLGLLAQAVAVELLVHRSELAGWNRQLRHERQRLYEEMVEIPSVIPYPSETNFILFRVEGDRLAVQQYLASREISVRDVDVHPLLRNCLRVTVGLSEENSAFLAALKTCLNQTNERVTA